MTNPSTLLHECRVEAFVGEDVDRLARGSEIFAFHLAHRLR